MKTALLVLVLILAAGLGWNLWGEVQRSRAAEAEAARLEAERESVLADVEWAEAQADTSAMLVDSLEALRAAESLQAARRARVLAQRADSLSRAIVDLIPEDVANDVVRVKVAEAVEELRTDYEERLTAKDVLYARAEETILALKSERDNLRSAQELLQEALGLAEKERDTWKEAANPSWFERIKRDAVTVGASVAIGYVGGKIG